MAEIVAPADHWGQRSSTKEAGVAAIFGLGETWWLATTNPFTFSADLATSIALAVVVVLTIRRAVRPRPPRLVPPVPTEVESPDSRPAPTRRPSPVLWLVALALLVAIELATYFAGWSGGRHQFPTLSSLYDTAARLRAAKAVIVSGWLALGWLVFTR